MDPYNPEFDNCKNFNDIEKIVNEQNLIYGANIWYEYIKDYTPESYLLELSSEQIKSFCNGEIPTDAEFKKSIENLIKNDNYTLLKQHIKVPIQLNH